MNDFKDGFHGLRSMVCDLTQPSPPTVLHTHTGARLEVDAAQPGKSYPCDLGSSEAAKVRAWRKFWGLDDKNE